MTVKFTSESYNMEGLFIYLLFVFLTISSLNENKPQ